MRGTLLRIFGKQGTAFIMLVFMCISLAVIFSYGQARAAQDFYMSRPQLGFELSYEFDNEQRDGPFVSTDIDTTTYTERLDIKTEGWIYHPALVIYTLILSPEWEQEIEESEGNKDETDVFLEGYTAEFTFMQYKPYTLTLFGRRIRSTSSSSFTQKSKRDTDLYGANLMLKYSTLPTNINYLHTESRQSGFFDTSLRSDQVRLSSTYDEMYGVTRLNLAYTDTLDSTLNSKINTVAKEADIHNFYRFKSTKERSLNSSYNYRDTQNANFAEKGFSLNENLYVKHMENLNTNYNARFERYNQQTPQNDHAKRENHFLGFNLQHMLYENLRTSLFLNTYKNDTDSNEITNYTAGGDWNYRRKIPVGLLTATVGQKYSVFDENPNFDVTGTSSISGESITITNITPDFLEEKRVQLHTIRVFRDLTRAIEYTDGIDYRVESIGEFTRISCILGGQIDALPGGCAAGQSLIVDYRYISDLPFDYSITTRNYGLSLDLWNSLRVYSNFVRTRQRFLRGTRPSELSASQTITAGIEKRWKWSKTTAEYIDVNSTDLPTESWQITEILTFRPTARSFLSFSASTGRTRFKDIVYGTDTDRFYTYRGIYQLVPFNRSRFTVESFFTRTSGITNTKEDTGISSTFAYRFNIYTADISYYFLDERDKSAEETFKNHTFMVTIKRDLF